jgi:dihydroorotate dehydrogenase (fumarate)
LQERVVLTLEDHGWKEDGMARLDVTYMGLQLRNPLVVASSSLTGTVEKLERCEEAGAGAVVLKSLFEEQIEGEVDSLVEEGGGYDHTEAADYLRRVGMHQTEAGYLDLVTQARKKLSIPVIASLNCVSAGGWTDYAARLADAGADGLELNIALLPSGFSAGAADIERAHLKVVEKVRTRTSIPLAVKLGPYFTSLPALALSLRNAGAAALVLFNRFYQFDFDIERMAPSPGYHLSTAHEIHVPLRWVAILSGEVGCDLAASTGVHDGTGVVKQLLAGAKAVQLCSALFQKGLGRIGTMTAEVTSWMDTHGFEKIEDFRGRLSRERQADPAVYERLQYLKVYGGME